jgi:chromosomal replication initiator protein
MYLCRLLTTTRSRRSAKPSGGRDHGSVIHACRTVEVVMEQDDRVRHSVE